MLSDQLKFLNIKGDFRDLGCFCCPFFRPVLSSGSAKNVDDGRKEKKRTVKMKKQYEKTNKKREPNLSVRKFGLSVQFMPISPQLLPDGFS